MNQSNESGIDAIRENVRHNEKAVDRLEADLKDFRSEVSAKFDKVDAEFKSFRSEVSSKFDKVDAEIKDLGSRIDRLGWTGLIGIVSILTAQIVPHFLGLPK